VADHLRDLLGTALNVQNDKEECKVRVFFDDNVLVSGESLTTLPEKARRSALLLVLMSPLYDKRPYCRLELEGFFSSAASDGRGQKHCIVVRIQPLPREAWPKLLKDERGDPVLYLDLVDPESELPQGLNNLSDPKLSETLIKIFIEIKGKLVSLKEQLDARRQMASARQRPADRPVIYLDADPDDQHVWEKYKKELKGVAIVKPASLLGSSGFLDWRDRKWRSARQQCFQVSNALVLLHGAPGKWINQAISTSYFDRRILRQRYHDLPWAILDQVGQPPTAAEVYEVPCVPTSSEEWRSELLAILGLDSPSAGSGQ